MCSDGNFWPELVRGEIRFLFICSLKAVLRVCSLRTFWSTALLIAILQHVPLPEERRRPISSTPLLFPLSFQACLHPLLKALQVTIRIPYSYHLWGPELMVSQWQPLRKNLCDQPENDITRKKTKMSKLTSNLVWCCFVIWSCTFSLLKSSLKPTIGTGMSLEKSIGVENEKQRLVCFSLLANIAIELQGGKQPFTKKQQKTP